MTDTTNDQGPEPQALPGDGLREGIVDELRRRIGDSLLDVELRPNDDLWVRVATPAWAATGNAVRAMGFSYFCFLSGIDWMPSPYGRGENNPDEPTPERSTEIVQGVTGGETRLQVFARVVDLARHVGITIKADVADEAPSIGSWHAIYAGANWHERECHEMFGIGFDGHPDLRNMYLPGDFEGHPLRKDFPLLSRMIKPWPGIVDVEPMPAEDEAEAPAADTSPTSETSATDQPTGAVTDSADEAAGTQEAPIGDVSSEAGAIVGAPAAAEALATSTDEAPAFESTEEAETSPAETQDADIDDATSAAGDTVVESTEPRPDAEATGPAEPRPDVESAPEEGTDIVAPTPETGEGSGSADVPVADVEGPYGLGSKAPRPDGGQPSDHRVKASSATMRFHVPGSEGYDELVPDVWFDSETAARIAGFTSPFEEPAEDRNVPRPDSGEEGDPS